MSTYTPFENVLSSPGKKVTAALNVNRDLEKTIQHQVIQKRLRIREFFLDFDRLRKGTVTQTQFKSCLSMLGLDFTEEQVSTLLDRYGSQDGLFRYREFCKVVDSVLETDENKAATINANVSSANYTTAEQQIVTEAILSITHKVKSHRILIKNDFQDFDRTRSSHITRNQFFRVLTQQNLNPGYEVLELICRRYCDKGNETDVNYVKFCNDIERAAAVTDPSIKNDSTAPSLETNNRFDPENKVSLSSGVLMKNEFNSDTTADDVEQRIQAEIVMKRIRVNEFFRDFDKLRKGYVKENYFNTVLGMLNIRISEKEQQALFNKYKNDLGMFKYPAFCDNIDAVFTTKGIEKNPTLQVAAVTQEHTYAARRRMMSFTDEEKENLVGCLTHIQSLIRTRRVLLKPQFQDFDTTKTGHVTRNQFQRVLNQLSINLNEATLNLVLKRYLDKGNRDDVNYVDFCLDVDKPDEIFQVEEQKKDVDLSKATRQPISNQTIIQADPEDLDDLLNRIRTITKEKRVRISEFLRDFDKLRSGTVSTTQLRTGLSMAGVMLSNNEFSLLTSTFGSPVKPGYVKWKEFCDMVESAFVGQALEKNPMFEGTNVNLATKYGRAQPTNPQKNIARDIKDRWRAFVQKHRLNAKPSFQDWDRHNRMKVSAKQFRQVLASLGFDLSEDEFQSITKLYASDDGQVRYLAFLSDTTPTESSAIENDGVQTSVQAVDKVARVTGPRSLEIDELMQRIKHQIKQKRLRPLEFFQDHDPLRKGFIAKSKFRGALDMIQLSLTSKDLDLLENFFQSEFDNNKVNYAKFNSEIETVFTVKGLEKNPTYKLQDFQAPSYLDPNDVLNDSEEAELNDVLVELGRGVAKFHIMLKPFFQDKDRARCGKVSQPRFRSIMDNLKLPVSDRAYTLVCKRFASAGNEFNYVDFVNVMRHYSGDDTPI